MRREGLFDTQSWITKRRNELEGRATSSEIALKEAFERIDLKFKFQSARWRKKELRILDFYLKPGINIEVDGGYHTEEKDLLRDKGLLKAHRKWIIIRIKNEEVLKDPDFVAMKIKELMDALKRPNHGLAIRGKRIHWPELMRTPL